MTTTIRRLKVRDFKRIEMVTIEPSGRVIELRGRNAQGKSSIIDAIQAAAGGKRNLPDKPLRKGAADGQVDMTLTNGMEIKLRINEAGQATVRLSQEGAEIRRPQETLDALYTALSFDPLGFTTMDPKKQAETLRALLGLDFSKVDGTRTKLYNDRTEVNRDRDRAAARLTGSSASFPPDLPAEEIVLADLLAERRGVNDKIAEYARVEREFDGMGRDIQHAQTEVERIKAELVEAEEELRRVEERRGRVRDWMSQNAKPDTTALDRSIATAEETNKHVRARAARQTLEAEVNGFREKSEQLTQEIDTIDAWKLAQIESASKKLPIAGLGFTEDGVTFRGVPFSQASRAEQIRVSVAMACAMNPDLRVMLIRDGSVLDDDSRALLADLAEKYEAQLWIEIVADEYDDTDGGIVIEDGRVKEGRTKKLQPASTS